MRIAPTVRLAAGLWLAWAVVVWNVTFDWETRAVARAFAVEQLERRAQHLPPVTIRDGFRPRVRAAAVRSSLWAGLVIGVGAGALLLARQRLTNAGRRSPGTPAGSGEVSP